MIEKQTLSEPTTTHRLHCIGCGADIAGVDAAEDFRCRTCGNLFEVEYPELLPSGADSASPAHPKKNGAVEWKELWDDRRLSREPLDRSGVWRFRELLPFLADERNV